MCLDKIKLKHVGLVFQKEERETGLCSFSHLSLYTIHFLEHWVNCIYHKTCFTPILPTDPEF